MRKLLCLFLGALLAFAFTGCKAVDEVVDVVKDEIEDSTFTVEGTIEQEAVIFANDDVEITFQKAYYEPDDFGLYAEFKVVNKLDKDISMGFEQVYVNGMGFYAWQVDEVVKPGESNPVYYKMVSGDNLKMASIDYLHSLYFVEAYYYADGIDKQYQEYVTVENPDNPDYEQKFDFGGKNISIDYNAGELLMKVGSDRIITNREGDAELYVFFGHDGKIPVVLEYELVVKGNGEFEETNCGGVFYDADVLMEAIPFAGLDASSCQSITIKNLVLSDIDDNELFKLDELTFDIDDLETITY